MASFDCFGPDTFRSDWTGDLTSEAGGGYKFVGGIFIWFFESKPLSDWYEVVIAVVAVGPLAVGVKYSV